MRDLFFKNIMRAKCVPMGPLQLSDHVVQNRRTGEQMTHGDMLNKENSNLVALFNCVICSPVWRSWFCTTWSLSCKGSIMMEWNCSQWFGDNKEKNNMSSHVLHATTKQVISSRLKLPNVTHPATDIPRNTCYCNHFARRTYVSVLLWATQSFDKFFNRRAV